MIDVQRFERRHIDCMLTYQGPELPGFPYSRGERIHAQDIKYAAYAYVSAKREQRDREQIRK